MEPIAILFFIVEHKLSLCICNLSYTCGGYIFLLYIGKKIDMRVLCCAVPILNLMGDLGLLTFTSSLVVCLKIVAKSTFLALKGWSCNVTEQHQVAPWQIVSCGVYRQTKTSHCCLGCRFFQVLGMVSPAKHVFIVILWIILLERRRWYFHKERKQYVLRNYFYL